MKNKKNGILIFCFLFLFIFIGCKTKTDIVQNEKIEQELDYRDDIYIKNKTVVESESLVNLSDLTGVGLNEYEEKMSDLLYYEDVLVSYVENVGQKNGWLSWEPSKTKTEFVVQDETNGDFEYAILEDDKGKEKAIVSVGYLGETEESYITIVCIADKNTNTVSYYEVNMTINPDGSLRIISNGELSSDNEKIEKATGFSTKYFGKNGMEILLLLEKK